MKALPVVTFQEGNDLPASFLDSGVDSAINLFGLERLHEALGLGVVIGISFTAHAGADAILLEQADIVAATILHASIRVVNKPGELVGHRVRG